MYIYLSHRYLWSFAINSCIILYWDGTCKMLKLPKWYLRFKHLTGVEQEGMFLVLQAVKNPDKSCKIIDRRELEIYIVLYFHWKCRPYMIKVYKCPYYFTWRPTLVISDIVNSLWHAMHWLSQCGSKHSWKWVAWERGVSGKYQEKKTHTP